MSIEPARHEPIRTRNSARWRVELLPRRSYEAHYTPAETVIGYAFESQSGTHAFASDRVRAFRVRAHTLAVVPAGCEVFSRSDTGGEYLTLATAGAISARQFTDAPDAAATAAAHALRALLLADADDPLLFDHHAETLAARAGLTGAAPQPEAARWMTDRRLQRIAEIVEARLEHGLTVADIAADLGLSSDFLCRAFKAAVGQTPHAYILDRRIARARGLIRAGADSLSDVAYAAGFSSHAHMSTVFRQRLGITPHGFRRALA